jgi:hypothetical protein
MKAAIMTFHRGASPGAFLQAWFLWKVLGGLGIEARFLDPPWKSLLATRLANIARSRRRGVAFMTSELRNVISYGFAYHRTLPKWRVSNNRFPADLDLLFIGSDEVWNIRNPYHGFMYPMMWAAEAKCRVVTYAPSMGGLSGPDALPVEAWRAIAGYHRVSVRDCNTLQAALSNLGYEPAHVCDPTLLRQEGDAAYACPTQQPFILVYTTGGVSRARIDDIRAYAKAHKLRIVSTGPSQPWCDMNLSHIHPLAAHALFEHAACVYAGTFHGMILGRKFRKPLAVEFPASKVTKSRCFLDAYCHPFCRISEGDSVGRAWAQEVNPAENQDELGAWIAASRGYLADAVKTV